MSIMYVHVMVLPLHNINKNNW